MLKQTLPPLRRSALLGAALLASDTLAANMKRYDIPAGDAVETLRRYAELSGCETLFSSELIRGVRTAAVRGTYSAHEALRQMLRGTRLVAVVDEVSGAIALRRAEAVREPRRNEN